jgi:hypothetical protein
MSGFQDILAEFVQGVKESDAQWYFIKPLQKGIPSLPDLLQVSPEHLQSLFVKFRLAKLDKTTIYLVSRRQNLNSFRWTFTIQDACGSTQCTVKGMPTKQYL